MYTCKGTHIDAYMWVSSRMTEVKVSSWIVMVNVIRSTCCFDFIYKIVLGNIELLLLIPLIRAIPSHSFALNFVGTVPFLTKCLMMFSIIITYPNKQKDGLRFFIFSSSHLDWH